MLKAVSGIFMSLCLVLSTSGAAFATSPSLPSTTSWSNAGLQEMVRFAGPISVSIDGAGFATSGTIQVDKPANSTVIAAYLTSSIYGSTTAVPDVTLNGSPVTFSHTASGNIGFSFVNHFSDVTTIVKSTIDSAPAGIIEIALTEGANSASIDGQSLIVVFDNPAKPSSSVIVMFGASKNTGDSFSFTFPAITDLSAQVPTLSLGIGFSFQSSANRGQQSDVKLSTSTNTSLQTISLTAGSFDDGAGANGALLTVGGVGDSPALPSLTANADDDELYGLGSFLSLGDTSLDINTRNASGDDNLFLSILYFEGVTVAGAVTVGSSPVVWVGSAPAPAAAPVAVVTPTLATTGPNSNESQILFGSAVGLFMLGALSLLIRRRLRN